MNIGFCDFTIRQRSDFLSALYAFGLTYVMFLLVNSIRSMRVDEEGELADLDVPEFGMLAYPEDEALLDIMAIESRVSMKA